MAKFSIATIELKAVLRQARLNAGNSMKQGAKALGLTVKKLEDIETIRDYGSHIDYELLLKAARLYRIDLNERAEIAPASLSSNYYERPNQTR